METDLCTQRGLITPHNSLFTAYKSIVVYGFQPIELSNLANAMNERQLRGIPGAFPVSLSWAGFFAVSGLPFFLP